MKHPTEFAVDHFVESQADPSSLKTEWLTTSQAADYLGISVGTLRNMTSNGKIPYYKFGKLNRYRLPELRELLLSGKRGKSYGL
jgi:excisionase family DNA binding protein